MSHSGALNAVEYRPTNIRFVAKHSSTDTVLQLLRSRVGAPFNDSQLDGENDSVFLRYTHLSAILENDSEKRHQAAATQSTLLVSLRGSIIPE